MLWTRKKPKDRAAPTQDVHLGLLHHRCRNASIGDGSKLLHEADWAKHDAIAALRQAVNRLSVLKERNPAAIAGERVLTQCLDKLGCGPEKP